MKPSLFTGHHFKANLNPFDPPGMIRLEESPPRRPAISLRRALGSFSCIEIEIDGDGRDGEREWVGLRCGRFEGRTETEATRYAVDGGNGNHGLDAQVGAGDVEGGWEFHPSS